MFQVKEQEKISLKTDDAHLKKKNLMQVRRQQLELDMEQYTGSK